LPMRQMFDVLYLGHERVGHMKVISTYKNVQKIIWNVTQAQSKLFCSLCPNCILQSPRIKKLRGAAKPIRSSKFRDRFQVDLVDMSANRRKNIYGIVMRYILVIKDHFSGFMIADCIPRKRAQYVAHILNQYFSVIGFPLIFHTDNGKEFTAKSILEFLKTRSPHTTTVTGRPRTPRDQGSV
jgi:transposase InsO family protein